MAKVPAIDEFVKKSSLVIKRTPDEKISVQADFVYKSARYELNGQIDAVTGRPEPFHARLSWGQAVIYEETSSVTCKRAYREVHFGKATKGVRVLATKSERVMGGTIVTGHADGRELVPYFRSGLPCSCEEPGSKPPRPLLAWGEGSSTQTLKLSFSPKAAPEFEGLRRVMDHLANQPGGPGGGVGSDVDWFLCYINCVIRELICVVFALTRPAPDIFIIICFGIYNCFDWCTFVGSLP
jgi:hypothetical protein